VPRRNSQTAASQVSPIPMLYTCDTEPLALRQAEFARHHFGGSLGSVRRRYGLARCSLGA
jgi:hypothetical protein